MKQLAILTSLDFCRFERKRDNSCIDVVQIYGSHQNKQKERQTEGLDHAEGNESVATAP